MLRMNCKTFDEILTAIEPVISKRQVVGGHKVISPAARLTLTLRFLATGETFRSLHFQFRMGRSTISYIVREVCQAIYSVLGPRYLTTPSRSHEWKRVSQQFEHLWQLAYITGFRRSFILRTKKKVHEPEILHPKKYLASKFSTQR